MEPTSKVQQTGSVALHWHTANSVESDCFLQAGPWYRGAAEVAQEVSPVILVVAEVTAAWN